VSLSATVGSINATQAAFYAADVAELYAISGSTAFGSGTGQVFRIDTEANALAATLDVPNDPSLTGLSAVGYDAVRRELTLTRLPVGAGGGPLFDADGTAVVLGRDGALVRTFSVGNSPGFVAYLPDDDDVE
jgi:hypothetical protein